jgi:hypothetical protein
MTSSPTVSFLLHMLHLSVVHPLCPLVFTPSIIKGVLNTLMIYSLLSYKEFLCF